MAVVKEGLQGESVIIQEGVPTFESIDEPVVYMIDRFVVGGFYRMHAERGKERLYALAGELDDVAVSFPHGSRPCTYISARPITAGR